MFPEIPVNWVPKFPEIVLRVPFFPTISPIFRFHFSLLESGYPATIFRKYLTEVKFADKKTALQQRNKSAGKKTSAFCYIATRLYLAWREYLWGNGILHKTNNG